MPYKMASLYRPASVHLSLISVCLIFLCCCTTKNVYTSSGLTQPVKINPSEKIGLAFNCYLLTGDTSGADCSLEKRRFFQDCLTKSIVVRSPGFNLISLSDVPTLYPDSKCSLLNPDEDGARILAGLSASQEIINAATYAVFTDIIRDEWGTGGGGAAGTLSIGWKRKYMMSAYIYDIQQMIFVGSFTSTLEGGVVWLLFPPVPIYTVNEGSACEYFGETIADFFMNK